MNLSRKNKSKSYLAHYSQMLKNKYEQKIIKNGQWYSTCLIRAISCMAKKIK
jgi:hypothetical protein